MPRTFKAKVRATQRPLGGLDARVTRLETMLFELNSYVVRLVNHKGEAPNDFDVDFLEAAEEFRRSLVAELRTLDLKGVRNGTP